MKLRLIILFSSIILLPVFLLFMLGLKMNEQEQEYIKEKFLMVLNARLADLRTGIGEILARQERELINYSGLARLDTENLRQFVRAQRMVRQVFVIDPAGQLIHPPPEAERTDKERLFFIRTESIWLDREKFYKPWENAYSRIRTSGWYSWFWGTGVNLIFWIRETSGAITGIEIDSTALTADIIGQLPDSGQLSPELSQGRMILSDVRGNTIYQWGAYQPAEQAQPLTTIPVLSPLDGWNLAYYLADEELTKLKGQSTMVNLTAGVIILVLLILAMAVYFYRENSRAMREAARKVTFVNQVSHELKTPLTNIRLYAELLEKRLQPEDEKTGHYLSVIVSESRRLSRLIQNVLSFARERRQGISMKKTPGSIDEVIRGVIENFRQPLAAAGIEVDFSGQAGETVWLDKDLLEQILGNLFSNVEKYAAAGKQLLVKSCLEQNLARITVADQGPGIPREQQVKIFKPFFRLSHKLTDGVSGTGLGLTIARQLARAHGGDVISDPVTRGARFTVTLDIRKEVTDDNPGSRG